MKSFKELMAEAKATYCGRCGTTHVAPKDGGTCPALKEEQLEEASLGDHKSLRKYSDNLSASYKDDKTSFEIAADHIKSGDKKSLAAHLQHSDTDVRDKILKHVKKDHWHDLGYKSLHEDQIEEGLFDNLPSTKAGHDYMDKKREQRNAEHEKQDPKMAKMYAKNMVDTEKAAKKANERGIKKSASDFDWKVRNGVQRGKLPEEAEIEEAKDTVVKDKDGKVVSWSHEGDWKKADKKNPIGKVHNMSDKARRETEKLQKEETMSAFDPMAGYMSQIAKDVGVELVEKTLTPAELKKREEVAKAIERENPSMEMGKKMAIATATAKKVAEDTHYCAKHVYSERFGEGFVVEGAHAEPDDQGLIEWYDVDFGGQIRRVMTEKVKVMHAEYHMNHKKKKMSEEDKPHTEPKTAKEKDLAKLAPPHDKITHADVMVGRGVKKEELSSKEKMKRGMYNEEADLEDVILESDEVIVEGSITLGDQEHNTRRVPIKHYDEFKKTYPGSRVKFRGPKQGKDNTSKADATHFYVVNKKEKMSEDVEQIDELSKQTLGSYAKKAAGERAIYTAMAVTSDNGSHNKKEFVKKAAKRGVGLEKAVDKLTNEETDLEEAMISYSDFKDKLAMHRKAGNKVTDDKYNNDKATYTTIDKEGMGRKVTHTASGTKMETLGKMGKQDDEEGDEAEVKQTDKRGRGRPTGSKSGARRHN